MRYVVLLRGINLGSRNRIAMPALREGLEGAGFAGVRTLLQSGNVVLDHDGGADAVEAGVLEVLRSRLGSRVDVLVREGDDLPALVAANPLEGVADDGRRHFVVFCSQPPDPETVPEAEPPERLVVGPMELHVWCPDGMRESAVMRRLSRRGPAPVTTFRNFDTVTKLAAMVEA